MDKTAPEFSIRDFDGMLIQEAHIEKIISAAKKEAPYEDWGLILGKSILDLKFQDTYHLKHATQKKLITYQKKYPKFAWATTVFEMPTKELDVERRITVCPSRTGHYAEEAWVDMFSEKTYAALKKVQEKADELRTGEKILVVYHTHVYDRATMRNKKKNREDIAELSDADKHKFMEELRFFWPSHIHGKQQKHGDYPTLGLGLAVVGFYYNGEFFFNEDGRPVINKIDEKKIELVGLKIYKLVPSNGLIMHDAPSIKEVEVKLKLKD